MKSVPTVESASMRIQTPIEFKQKKLEDQIKYALRSSGFASLKDVKGQYIVFDLSQSFWHDLGALLWSISLFNKLRTQGNMLNLVFPEPDTKNGGRVWDFLNRWRFFEALAKCVEDPVNLLCSDQVPYIGKETRYAFATGTDELGEKTILHTLRLLELTTIKKNGEGVQEDVYLGSFLDRFANQVIVYALSRLCGWDLATTKSFVHLVIEEGVRNSLDHSEGSFANIAMRIDNKYVILAIADDGIGIPAVLRKSLGSQGVKSDEPTIKSDVELIKYYTDPDFIHDSYYIEYSVRKGTTSRKDRQGMGLYYLKSHITDSKGELRIRSGKACVDFTTSGAGSVDDLLDSPGTMIRIKVPRSNNGS